MRRVRSSSASWPSANTPTEEGCLSDTESLEPIGDAESDDVALSVDANEIRAEIEQAREATDRFRAKATELIKQLRDREAQARNDAITAEAAAQSAREEATGSHEAAQEAIEHAKRIEARATAKAREIITKATKTAREA